jgi:hypothetical protein
MPQERSSSRKKGTGGLLLRLLRLLREIALIVRKE